MWRDSFRQPQNLISYRGALFLQSLWVHTCLAARVGTSCLPDMYTPKCMYVFARVYLLVRILLISPDLELSIAWTHAYRTIQTNILTFLLLLSLLLPPPLVTLKKVSRRIWACQKIWFPGSFATLLLFTVECIRCIFVVFYPTPSSF